jgi:16S rRNA (uracil1498-N3)-methyltransferase
MHQISQIANRMIFVNCNVHYFYSHISIRQGHWELKEEEWRHIKALRIRNGEQVVITDGKGGALLARFELHNKVPQLIELKDLSETEAPKGLIVALPVTQDVGRIEWLIEKAVELGVEQIQLIQTDWTESAKYSLERLNKIAVAAMKQSQRLWLPPVLETIPLNRFIELHTDRKIYFAHCHEGVKQSWKEVDCTLPCCLLIGPEGDFSQTEVQALMEANAIPVGLGGYRLRTETAALAAVAHFYLAR